MTTFSITFHGPFHVGTGDPGAGIDRRVDPDSLLPATSLKGLMRAALTERLGIPATRVDRIFGAPGRVPATWRWTDAVVPEARVQRTTRIVIDDATGTVDEQLLMFGEQVQARHATFEVQPAVLLDATAQEEDELLLRAAALSVTSLGGGRRRGEGWVTIAGGADWTLEDSRRLLGVKGAAE